MPLFLAVPVIHSSGAYIATAGGAYIAGTMSATAAGAMIAGNAVVIGATTAAAAVTGFVTGFMI